MDVVDLKHYKITILICNTRTVKTYTDKFTQKMRIDKQQGIEVVGTTYRAERER